MPNLNLLITGANSQNISLDARWLGNSRPKSIILFCHGYKGFKDWGGWNQMADYLSSEDTAVVKFNFSHSGIGDEDLTNFSRLDLFQENNYSLEVEDVGHVLSWIKSFEWFENVTNIHLMGHSRGGGIAVLAAAMYKEISSLVTLAGVCDFENRFPLGKELEKWKKDGVFHVLNGRTGQKMPHGIQFLNNFIENQVELNIKLKIRQLTIPIFVVHASDDQAVHISSAMKLKRWNPQSEILMIASGGHTFGLKHPWNQEELPQALLKVLEEIKAFLS